MKNIFFIRSNTGTQSWEYYDSKIEAVIFGDIEGYHYFIQSLENGKNAEKSIRCDEIDASSNSMQVLITPACKLPSEYPLLRIIERPIFWNQITNMELVICGNRLGYENLIDLIKATISQTIGTTSDLENHFHLDDAIASSYLLPRSISLNIRFPLLKWTLKDLGVWANMTYHRQESFLPSDISYLLNDPEPYFEPSSDLIARYLNYTFNHSSHAARKD